MGRWLARGAGVALIGLVLWLVGLEDRVTDTSGVEHRGRVVSVSRDGTVVVLRTGDGEKRIPVRDARDVREGLGSTFRTLGRRPGLALLGFLFHLLGVAVSFVRWGVLLAGADLKTPLGAVFRLGLVGQFFASVLPGSTASGDLVKALYVARTHAGRRTRAVVTVFADRLLALLVLCGIAVVAVLFATAGSWLATARTVLLVTFLVGGVCLLLLLSARARALLRLSGLAARLPFQRVVVEIQQAALIYGNRPRILALSALLGLTTHALSLTAFFFYARALGDPLPLLVVCVAIPVASTLSAVPALPGGWGVGDLAFFVLLSESGVPGAQAVALSFTFRLAHTLMALPGGLMLAGTTPKGETAPCPSS